MITVKSVKDAFARFGITEFVILPRDRVILLPGKTLEKEYKSCIMFLIPYNTGMIVDDGYNMGLFARTLDYHAFAKHVGESVSNELASEDKGCVFTVFCDSSPTDEKATAIASGLGSKGRNTLLINKTFGTYCFISEIYTDAEAEYLYDESGASVCIGCTACKSACPVGAIKDDGFDREKCLSFISQKKTKTEEDMKILKENKTVWGCDICQQVCPVNKKASLSVIEYFSKDFISNLTADTLKDMTDDEYSKRSFSYRKRSVIEKNIDTL